MHFSSPFAFLTPTKYVQKLRLDAAQKMLETSQDSIDIITDKVGYSDTSAFRLLFKHRTGLTSSAYRKRFSLFSPQIKVETPIIGQSVVPMEHLLILTISRVKEVAVVGIENLGRISMYLK